MQALVRAIAGAWCPAGVMVAGLRCSTTALRDNASAASGQQLRSVAKDRRAPVSVETSLGYMESAAYRATYGQGPVWLHYRANHKGHIPPRRTRRTCIRGGRITTGSPCPICRDELLLLHYRNTRLLNHFVSEFNGELLKTSRTGLCRVQQLKLQTAMYKARQLGTISYHVPFREYNYDEYRLQPKQ